VAKGFRRRLKAYRLLRQPQAAVVLGGASKKQPDRRRDGDIPLSFATPTGKALAYVYFEEEPGRPRGGGADHRRRGPAHRRHHRQAADTSQTQTCRKSDPRAGMIEFSGA
jgi:hypothetical protein